MFMSYGFLFFVYFFAQMKKYSTMEFEKCGEIGMFSATCNSDESYVGWELAILIGQWSSR